MSLLFCHLPRSSVSGIQVLDPLSLHLQCSVIFLPASRIVEDPSHRLLRGLGGALLYPLPRLYLAQGGSIRVGQCDRDGARESTGPSRSRRVDPCWGRAGLSCPPIRWWYPRRVVVSPHTHADTVLMIILIHTSTGAASI